MEDLAEKWGFIPSPQKTQNWQNYCCIYDTIGEFNLDWRDDGEVSTEQKKPKKIKKQKLKQTNKRQCPLCQVQVYDLWKQSK